MTENTKPDRRKKALRIIAIVIAAVIAVCAVGFTIYVNIYYQANDVAVEAAENAGAYANDGIGVQEVGGSIAFVPKDPKAGFIFYPGGKVQAEAYAPLMQDLAKRDVLSVLCRMPFNLAIFNIDAANGIAKAFPQVPAENWYIGGHSLGGSMAAMYTEKNVKAENSKAHFAGIVFLGSYSTADLSNLHMRVLSIYGSNDGVMNREAYDKNKSNLPTDAQEVILDGGNHAQFGSYGEQDGDGNATITAEQQWQQTADIIADWMNGSLPIMNRL